MDLVEAVSELRDPAVIPLLVEASGTGTDPMSALARFGDLAIPVPRRQRYLTFKLQRNPK
jgi:hypothetical protein